MSISDIQRMMVLEESARFYFANGEKPKLVDVMNDISHFFSDYKIGRPFNVEPYNIQSNLPSDVDEYNDNMLKAMLNISILYECLLQEAERSMALHTIAKSRLENLRTRRDKVESDIDDFLLSTSNTDGYFYTLSDYFSTLDNIDTSYTSAFVDVDSNNITIPPVAEFTKVMPYDAYTINSTKMKVNGVEVAFQEDSPFEGAVDGLSNTNWAISKAVDQISEVVVETWIDLRDYRSSVAISKLEIDPFTMVPVQIYIETENSSSGSQIVKEKETFGQSIKSGTSKMAFVDSARETTVVYITMRKTEPDYEIQSNGTNKYVYVFGASHFEISRQAYDNSATFVSQPISFPEDIAEDHVIDVVSLSVKDFRPHGTSITYFIAPDEASNNSLDDFRWQQIYPMEDTFDGTAAALDLSGATNFSKSISANPASNEINIIERNSSSTDLTKRNPSTAIIDGVSIYRIAEFSEEFIPQSVTLEEGIDTTRIFVTELSTSALDNLDFWKDYVNGVDSTDRYYGKINSGNGFFYGGDIGSNNKSVYIETYLESPIERETLIKEFRKSDANSQLWDVYIYLNGRKIGTLQAGTDTALLPWKFVKGTNHIAMTVNIPDSSEEFPSPYLGTIDLMVGDQLTSFGTVKLGNWSYVDLFKMKYNETGQPKTFAIHNGEIISRREPTSNFRLSYTKSTGNSPTAVRLRADLQRGLNEDSVSPMIDSYSLRFSYGDK